MKQDKVIEIIESFAPPSLQASWDASGFQVAGVKNDIKNLAVCLDPTPQAVQAAVKLGADMVLSHHPLLLQPRLPKEIDSYHRVLALLFKNDMALYAAHTSLDANAAGPVSWLAEELELEDRVVLEPLAPGEPNYGFGLCGALPRALPFADFLRLVLGKCAPPCPALCGARPERARRVAICPGSGSSLMGAAADLGADVFVTGDVKHHAALEAPLCVLDVGHHCLEEEMMRRFSMELGKAAPDVTINFIPSASPLSPASVAPDTAGGAGTV